jgi:TonB family protein
MSRIPSSRRRAVRRSERHESEYRRHIAGATLASVAVHVALAITLLELGRDPVSLVDPRLHLGYRGPTRILPELEVLEPNSVQSYFSQRRQPGRQAAVEVVVREKIDPDPGPEPVPRPRPPEPRPRDIPTDPAAEPEIVQAAPALHRELSFSEDFVILKLVKPIYPEYELSRGIRARILVAVWVTPDGEVENEQVQEAQVDPPTASSVGFELATLEAVRQWKVKPPVLAAHTQGIWLTIPIRFDPLRDDFLDRSGLEAR